MEKKSLATAIILVVAIAVTAVTGSISRAGNDPAADRTESAVLTANELFYRAFARRDMKAMQEIWANDAPVAVIHPGWPGIDGREEVMKSWEGILGGSNAPDIVVVEPQVYVYGNTAFVVCYEVLGSSALIATNIFVKQGEAWKMVHHQAGATMRKVVVPGAA